MTREYGSKALAKITAEPSRRLLSARYLAPDTPTVRADEDDVTMLYGFRRLLRELDPASLAALLREVGHTLYNKEIGRWHVLIDISDELLDEATIQARRRIGEKWRAKVEAQAENPPAPKTPRATPPQLPPAYSDARGPEGPAYMPRSTEPPVMDETTRAALRARRASPGDGKGPMRLKRP